MRKLHPRGFSLVELLVVISIVAVLLAIMLPALQKSRDIAMTLRCTSSLRQLAIGDEAYRVDYRRWFVSASSYVRNLAPYTGTLEENYEWQGWGTNFRRYLNAHPFKCPLVRMNTEFEGPYGQAVMIMNVGGVTDFSLNTALHLDGSSNPYITRRRDNQLVHPPAQVFNFQDAQSGAYRADYSTFSNQFRHNGLMAINQVYVDGHVSTVPKTGVVLAGASFNRNANNTVWIDDRPYFWW